MIPTDLYRFFYYTAMFKNLTKAAEALYVSQPAVSKAIKNLEELSGCKLFIRRSSGVELTSEGELLYSHVKAAYERLMTGESVLERLSNVQEGIVRIGVSNTLCKYFLMPQIKSFHEKYPDIRIQIINRSSGDTLPMLNEGAVDMAITSRIPEAGHYDIVNLITIQDIFVANNRDGALSGKIPIDRLKQYPVMMLERGNTTRDYIDSFLTEHNITLSPEIEIGSIDFLIEFAKIGLGVAAVIKEFVLEDLHKGLVCEIKTYPEIPKREVSIILYRQIPASNAAKAFIEHLKTTSPLAG